MGPGFRLATYYPDGVRQAGEIRKILGRPRFHKLTVGASIEAFGQQDDRVIDAVMRMPEEVSARQPLANEAERLQTKTVDREADRHDRQCQVKRDAAQVQAKSRDGGKVQCRFPGCAEEPSLQGRPEEDSDRSLQVTPNVESRINRLKGTGRAMFKPEQDFFKPRLGIDFSKVRIHDDAQAARAARSVKARAFTLGHHIVLGAGAYATDKLEGRKLLAHELAHVAQKEQHHAIAPVIQRLREDELTPQKKGVKGRRGHIVFIIGKDKMAKVAAKYWKGKADYRIRTAKSLLDIQNVLKTKKRPNNKPWGEISIVVHASPGAKGISDTGKLYISAEGKTKFTTAAELKRLVDDVSPLWLGKLPDTIVDEKTHVNIHGCRIGQNKLMLMLISRALGGKRKAPIVHAPKYFVNYRMVPGSKRRRRRRRKVPKYYLEKFWAVAEPAYPSRWNEHQIAKAFKNKYAALRNMNWRQMIKSEKTYDKKVGKFPWKNTVKRMLIPLNRRKRDHLRFLKVIWSPHQYKYMVKKSLKVTKPKVETKGGQRFVTVFYKFLRFGEKRVWRRAFPSEILPTRGRAKKIAYLRKNLKRQNEDPNIVAQYTWKFPKPAVVKARRHNYGSVVQDTFKAIGRRTIHRVYEALYMPGTRTYLKPKRTNTKYFGTYDPGAKQP